MTQVSKIDPHTEAPYGTQGRGAGISGSHLRSQSGTPLTRRAFVAGASTLGAGVALAAGPLSAFADEAGRGAVTSLIEKLAGTGPADATSAAAPASQATVSMRPTLLADLAQAADPDVQATAPDYVMADDFSNVVNFEDMYLSDPQQDYLRRFGFFLSEGYYSEFFECYDSNRYALTPNLVTVDSMMHTYHLYFSHLLKKTERDHLTWMLQDLSSVMLERASAQLDLLRGTEWESAAARVVALFAVGSRLQGLYAPVPDDVAPTVEAELALISEASQVVASPLTGDFEDYSQYIVRGYYEGDPSLEGYFRAMMWYGRRNFKQSDEDLDRSALLITLAIDEVMLPIWGSIYQVTSFFAGASDDNGFYEYRPLIDEAYGPAATVADLPGYYDGWQMFHDLTASTPAPQINSVPVADTGTDDDHVAQNQGFRFMGQRFSIDEAVFQQLIYNKVFENAFGEKRLLPDALDIPAAFGSDVARAILESRGADEFPNYAQNLATMRDFITNAPTSFWTASLYSQWLRTLQPLFAEKGEGYPAFMRGDAWARKDLLTFLGSYAELKHDTVLYSKQVMAEAGGWIEERDDRGYVEPEVLVYARLAALAAATSRGLAGLGLLADEDAANLDLLSSLATQLRTISEKELRDETLTDDEYELIRAFGVQLEHFWQEAFKDDATSEYFTAKDFPAAIVTDIASDPNGYVLEVGTGRPMSVYAVVPVAGTLRIAVGPVYSFYQFPWPSSDRLTDSSWRRMIGIDMGDDGSWPEATGEVQLQDWVREVLYDWRDYA